MLAAFQASLSPMLVMFLCIVSGYVLNRKKLCPANTGTVLSKLESNLLVPALVINTFMKYCTPDSLKQRYSLVLFSVASVAVAMAIGYGLACLFAEKGYQRNIYRYGLTLGNFGFMGNAVVLAMFGENTLYEYLLFCLPLNFIVYTWGISTLIPKEEKSEKTNPLASLINPSVLAIVLGAILGLTNAQKVLPSFVETTLGNLSACMGPIAMVLTGFIIGDYDIGMLLKKWNIYIVTAIRLLILPVLFLLLFKLFGADRLALTCILFAYGTPLGLSTVHERTAGRTACCSTSE